MDGLELFNVLVNEVIIDCNHDGKEFDNDFKEYIKQELASTYKTKKWRRNCIDTYSDLLDRAFMVSNEDEEHSNEENWVGTKMRLQSSDFCSI
jgi:hypothetical protein